ncbi:MAG: FAD:protein FMN transferase [Candidatus Methylomirabilales bacterium]
MKPAREIHYVMGTLLDIVLFDLPQDRAKGLLRQGFQEARRLERLLSAHDPHSALSGLNRQAGKGPVKVDTELWQLLHRCLDLQRRTHGAFDVGVGSLTDLWRQGRSPGPDPPRAFHLYSERWVELGREARLDLGGIGKGYAVDRLIERFTAAGVQRAFVNFGESSLYVLGNPPDAMGWPILVQGFDEEDFIGVVWAKDLALSTSQTLGRSLENTWRRCHILDPRTGIPRDRPVLSTIVAESATTAEAISTAAVLTDDEGWFELMTRFPNTKGLYLGPKRVLQLTADLKHCFSPLTERL